MIKKALFLFFLFFPLFFLMLQSLVTVISRQQQSEEVAGVKIILENVTERFKLFLEHPFILGLAGADFFAPRNLLVTDFEPYKKLVEGHQEIHGLSILDKNGKIIRSYPYERNRDAIGKISQNLPALEKSLKQGEDFWFSPPFHLYQGKRGFGFYIPMKKDQELKGWFAPLINTEVFASHFRLNNLLLSYELIIKDQETGSLYFATAVEPEQQESIHRSVVELYGRKLVFLCWKKTKDKTLEFSLASYLAVAGFLSLLTVLIFILLDHRKKSRQQLADISKLLRLTSQEAHGKLIELYGELATLGPAHQNEVNYVTHLIEQIDLLQAMVEGPKELKEESLVLNPLLEKHVSDFNDLAEKKNVKVNLSMPAIPINVRSNSWLLENTVLKNVLTYAIIHCTPQSEIAVTVTSEESNGTALILITIPLPPTPSLLAMQERRLAVAGKAIEIFGGHFTFNMNMSGDMLIKIELPTH